MNTKTMRLPPRRVLMHTTGGASTNNNINDNKRKDRDNDFDALNSKCPKPITTTITTTQASHGSEPASSNQLLAGYLAHEFLTKGTLFGEPFDPARAQAVPVSLTESRKPKLSRVGTAPADKCEEKQRRYMEVVDLLKRDGAHLAGIVNPTQLARFLQM